ncbi:unnamed protein product, partial [Owenia fusiformis]
DGILEFTCTCDIPYSGYRCLAVDGGWCDWVEANSCDACSSNPVDEVFIRLCNCPQQKNGGVPCQGEALKFEPCSKTCDPCLRNPCLNGGTCFEAKRGGYTCNCLSEWDGKNCELDFNDC